MKMTETYIALGVLVVSLALTNSAAATLPTLEWIRQLGTDGIDTNYGVFADGLGNVYITGSSRGDLGGVNAGADDAFFSKYDSAGNFQWTEQLGTSDRDVNYSVVADNLGNVYISGSTRGDLDGTNAGSWDVILSKYDDAGNHQWTKQTGTDGLDHGQSVSVDELGNIYVSGITDGDLAGSNSGGNDAFLSKYDSSGNILWTEQFGTGGDDEGWGVSVDSGGSIYVTGDTGGDLGGPYAGGFDDVFLRKYDSEGGLQWTEQIGTGGRDHSHSVSTDGLGGIYITGNSSRDLGGPSAGSADAFLGKYDSAGKLQWIKQFGTGFPDRGYGVSADGLGNVYVSGYTSGDLGGVNSGSRDAFLRKYDSEGNLQWTEQLGTINEDQSRSIATDGLGNIYISGWTYGDLGETNAGDRDVFVAKYHDPDAAALVPEPNALIPVLLAIIGIPRPLRRRGESLG